MRTTYVGEWETEKVVYFDVNILIIGNFASNNRFMTRVFIYLFFFEGDEDIY